MKYLSVIQIASILILCSDHYLVAGWTNEEFEMFDLVEELNSINFYEYLGVSKDATVKEIKSAYRQLSVKYHPDKNPDDPNAHIKFRQLVGVYEALKDDDVRKSYHDVLEFGLPNWRQPMFYFRRARKMAMWQVGILLLVIITTGQYLAAWGSYFEKKISLQEMVETKLRKTQRSKKAQKEGPKVHEVQAELEQQYLTKPSLWNTAPVQLVRFGKYMIISFPFDAYNFINQIRRERQEEKERLLEQQLLEEEEKNIVPEPKKPRKRKTFAIPEKEYTDQDNNPNNESQTKNANPSKSEQTFVSGGLWTDDDINMLIKLCSKYPGGSPDRWNTISNIMRRPVGEVTYMAKRVLEDLSKKQAEEVVEENVKVKVKTKASKLDDTLAEKVIAWSKDEQKRLEMALQMYPKGGSADRWAKISSHVGKSKEECMQRFKYVADMVKKKKEQLEVEESDSAAAAAEPNVSSTPSSVQATPGPISATTPCDNSDADLKEAVHRQNSSSSNYSGSDNEWCIVEEEVQDK